MATSADLRAGALEHVRLGYAQGPYYLEREVTARVGTDRWLCTPRHAVKQGTKVRGIDDSSDRGSKANTATSVTEKLQLPTVDTLVALLKTMGDKLPDSPLAAWVLDETSAFRQIPIHRDHRRYAVISLWDCARGRLAHFVMKGHAFGLVAAVYNYNRRSAILNDWLRAMKVNAHHYYDDKFGFSTADVVEHDLRVASALHFLLGIPFNQGKLQCGTEVVLLGIQYNFGSRELSLLPKRRDELIAELSSITTGNGLQPGQAARLKGKLQFIGSHYRGRYGRSFLKAFADRQVGVRGPASDAAVMRAVRFWLYLLRSGAPARSFGPEDESFVHGSLWCDGYAPDHYNDSNPDPALRAGWVYVDHLTGDVYYGAWEPQASTIDTWAPRATQVVMVEMLAPVIAVHALGELLQDRRILAFIDSEVVEGALVKGYSGKPDIDELAGAFWALCVAGRVAPYIDRVPTDANPGDDPSRGVYD